MKPHAKTRRALLALLATLILTQLGSRFAVAQQKPLRFGVGPLPPTPVETKRAYEPFFAHLAKKLDPDFDLYAKSGEPAPPSAHP